MLLRMIINGLPLPTSPSVALPWAAPLSTLRALSDLHAWLQQHLGVGFDPALVEVLAALEPIHREGRHASVAELSEATRLPRGDVHRVITRLAGSGALKLLRMGPEQHIQLTPRMAEVLAELRGRLNQALVMRGDVRERHLLNRVTDGRLRAHVDAVFDRFDELEWLHLHNWGSSCYLMAQLVAGALAARGLATRVQTGYVEARLGRMRGLLGAPGTAREGQVGGHAFCVLEERCLIDFGLGNARRLINRDFFWAAAMDLALEGDVVAVVEHPRVGRVLWRSGWAPPEGEAQLAHCQPVSEELLRREGLMPAATPVPSQA
jgi:hypothetical protein